MRHLEYLSSNELLKYPFTDNASLKNNDYTIPADLLIDAVIFGKGTARYFVKYIDYDGSDLVLTVYKEPDIEVFEVKTPLSVIRTTQAATAILDGGNVHLGRFLFGQGLLSLTLPTKKEEFTLDQTEFLPCVVMPAPPLVYSIGILDNFLSPLAGDVKIVAGCNVVIDNEPSGLKISTGRNDDVACECEEPLPKERAIYTINGEPGHRLSRNFKITSDACINVKLEPNSNMVVISNECRPCCENCPEQLSDFEAEFLDKQSELTSLDARLTAIGY